MPLLDTELKERILYAKAFAYFFWGWVFILDFNINIEKVMSIDILPDIVGYILFAVAASKLSKLHSDVPMIQKISQILIVFGILDLALTPIANKLVYLIYLVGLAGTALFTLMQWKLCGAIADLARQTKHPKTEAAALFRRKFYLGYVILVYLLLTSSITMPAASVISFVIGFPLAVIAICLLMGLMKQAERICLS